MTEADSPRGRYAPSPTGHQTVGNAYLAVRAWLDVRARDGAFVLRIEDTDPDRTVVDDAEISAVLRLLGLDYDEGWDVGGPYGPYLVSERAARHREVAAELEASGAAYLDYTPPLADAAAHKRTSGAERGRTSAYRGNPEPVDGVAPVLRLRVPDDDGAVSVTDRIFGELRVPYSEIGEVALVRSDGSPTYHLASVVDDADMAISSVVRGADWLNFLPQHVLLYHALGVEPPQFAHVPLLHGTDGQKLSKRHGDLSIRTLVDTDGLPPGALMCYLANLGFEEDPTLRSLDELAVGFDVGRMGRSSPRFDPKKLASMCRRWIAEREDPDVLVAEILARSDVAGLDEATVRRMLPGVRGRSGSYVEAASLFAFLAGADVPGRDATVLDDALVDALLATEPWDADALEAAVAVIADPDDPALRKARLTALRDALAPGLRVTPPLHHLLVGLGRDRAATRLAAT